MPQVASEDHQTHWCLRRQIEAHQRGKSSPRVIHSASLSYYRI